MQRALQKGRLTDEELETYSRQIVLRDIGYEGQLKIRSAKVCVVGVGGLGCPVAVQLVAMGVGYIRLVDRDVVERSNLQRQHLYDTNSLGKPKVEVALERLSVLNPDVEIEIAPTSLDVNNAVDLVRGVDVVVDGLDRLHPRYAVNRACVQLKVPYVFGAAIEMFGNVSTIIPNKTFCLECLLPNMSDEQLPSCSVVGVHPSVLGVISSIETSEAVRLAMGGEPLLANKLLYYDLRRLSLDTITIARRDDCPVCGSKPSKMPVLERGFVEEICGRGGRRAFLISPRESLDLNLSNSIEAFAKTGYQLKVKTVMSIGFDYRRGVTVSLLRSGVMLVEGAEDQEDALRVYRRLVSGILGIPWSRIE
jgi:molybdopterin/thiamine biosynthesis adenylyltransferase